MPELSTGRTAAIRCFAAPSALDALRVPEGLLVGRIAPDELVVLDDPDRGAALLADLAGQLDPASSLVVDHGDGWTRFVLQGDGLEEVWARVSHLPLPDQAGAGATFLAGRVCDVAGKTFVRQGRVDILCGAEVAHHVRHRLELAGAPLGLQHADTDTPVALLDEARS